MTKTEILKEILTEIENDPSIVQTSFTINMRCLVEDYRENLNLEALHKILQETIDFCSLFKLRIEERL